jgi:hypothetical protein
VIEKWCDLNGPRICLRSLDGSLIGPVIEGWAIPEAEPGGVADFTLTIARGEIAEPADAGPLLFDGIMADRHPCVITQVGDREFYIVDDRISLLLGRRDGLLTVAQGAEKLVRGSVAFQALNAALALGDQYFLHAAALILPGNNAALMIFGRSGFGKTTTTLALVAAGFGFVTDDGSIVKRGPAGDLVWGLPLPLKVHRNSARMMPWLAPAITDRWNAEDEQPVTPAALAALLDRPLPIREPRPIAALIVLGERSKGEHRLAPLAKSETLLRIAGDNVARNLKGVTEHNRDRMRHVAELVATHPTYEMQVGPNIESLAETLLDGLGRPPVR